MFMLNRTYFILCLLSLLPVFLPTVACAQGQKEFKPNYDESKIPPYVLPDALICEDGKAVKNPEMWEKTRRPELLALFEKLEYGQAPARAKNRDFKVETNKADALKGKATRKEVLIPLTDKPDGPTMRMLLFVPNGVSKPVPAFLGLNFGGNHTVVPDPDLPLTQNWVYNDDKLGIKDNRANEKSRGTAAENWSVEYVLSRGYALATIHTSDIDPDFDDGFQNGVQPYFYKDGQTRPGPDEWGTIGAWAWGLSRALDYLETDGDVDGKRVAVMGHSRLGKTALWAGATDPRFALIVSNQSGCGGAALSKREVGETVWRINTSFPHWFCENFKKYNENETDLPIDQHELIALLAPRPVLVCSAEEDKWSDPRGEFLSARFASPVYELLGTKGLEVKDMPPVNQLVPSVIGYHIRPGKHAVGKDDWKVFCDYADRYLKK
jgi:hypothetical protein